MNSTHSQEMMVLIVDDVPDNLALLHATLDQAGYTVLVATDGFSAIERAANFLPDAILLDAMMPQLDGFETCRLLKQNPATKHIPIIFMTGLTESEHVVKGFQSGGVDYVTKPVQTDEVLARLATHISNSKLVNQREQMIDAAGIAMLALDKDGKVLWQTPIAIHMLQDNLPQQQAQRDDFYIRLSGWFTQSDLTEPLLVAGLQQNLSLSKLADTGRGAHLVLIQPQEAIPSADVLMQTCAVTKREAEVLYWVALGKTNRDIGEILELSPRTVNKHLEHIFTKLNVETRTAAVASALAKARGAAR
jgi:DNA-binding response OmpR family regulator/DNA-binding CsgD family transcriptional regulator